LGGGESGANGRDAQWPGYVTGCPERRPPLGCFLRAAGTGAELVTLGEGLSVSLGFFGAAG
jgi:hypothetical protein